MTIGSPARVRPFPPVPEGWLPVRPFARAHHASGSTALKWLADQGHELRRCAVPHAIPPVMHASAAALELWAAWHAAHLGRRRLSLGQVRLIRASPEPARLMAERLGVSESTISHIRCGRLYAEPRGMVAP